MESNQSNIQTWNFTGRQLTANANWNDRNAPVTVDPDSWLTLLVGTFDPHVKALQDNFPAWQHWATDRKVWEQYLDVLNLGDRHPDYIGNPITDAIIKGLNLDPSPDSSGMFPRAPYGNDGYSVVEGFVSEDALQGLQRLRTPLVLAEDKTLPTTVRRLRAAARHHREPWFKYGDKQIKDLDPEALGILEALGWVTWFYVEDGPSALRLTASNSALVVAEGPEGAADAGEVARNISRQRNESRAAYLQLAPLNLDDKIKVWPELPEHVRVEAVAVGTYLNELFTGGNLLVKREPKGEGRGYITEGMAFYGRDSETGEKGWHEQGPTQTLWIANSDPEAVRGRQFINRERKQLLNL